MANINIKRRHKLPRDTAKARVEAVAKDLQGKIGAKYHWKGDCLCFARKGASGVIDVRDDEIEVKVKLGLLLNPMKGAIERSIQKGFDGALSDSEDSKPA